MKQAVAIGCFVAVCLFAGHTFVALPASRSASPALRASAAAGQPERSDATSSASMALVGAGLVLGGVAAAASARANKPRAEKTVVKYTTAEILPAFTWVKAKFQGRTLKGADFAPGELLTLVIEGCDVCLGKTGDGKLFAVGDKSPPTGTSLSMGGEIDGDTVVDPQWGCRFNVFTGEVIEWCTSPPVLGGLIGEFMGGETELATFQIRNAFLSDDIEVLVDINAKKAYEADYWKGILDSQGKDDGTYY